MKPKKFDQHNEVRTIARERVGPVKSTRAITPKTSRKPKYKKRIDEAD